MGGVITHNDTVRVCPCVVTHGPQFVAIADALDRHFGDMLASGNGLNAVDAEPLDYGVTIAVSVRHRSGQRIAVRFQHDTPPDVVVAVFSDCLA